MQFVFREASLEDVDVIVSLVEAGYRGEASKGGWTSEADLIGGQRTDADSVAKIVSSSNGMVLLAEGDAEGVVGCCQLEIHDQSLAYFGMFSVRLDLQGAGIGRALLEAAERLARNKWDARQMEMTVIRQREELIAWYERRGYARTGETKPFPYGQEQFGLPKRDDLEFVVMDKMLL